MGEVLQFKIRDGNRVFLRPSDRTSKRNYDDAHFPIYAMVISLFGLMALVLVVMHLTGQPAYSARASLLPSLPFERQ